MIDRLETLVGNDFGLHANAANALSYVIAVAAAFILYRSFVFRAERGERRVQVLVFVVCLLIAFLLNQFVLFIIVEALAVHPAGAQIVAMATYTLSFYILNKRVVFAPR